MDRRMKGFAVLSTILVAFLVTLVAFARGSSALEKNYTLSAFTGIQLQLPLYGFVNTSADNSYSATINAVDDLVNQASVTVNNNLLTIALNDNSRVDAQFSSPQTIFISVPASVISSISVTGNAAINADGHTIDTSQQLSTSSSGSGTIVVSNASPAGVNSQANGQGTTVVTGNLGAVSYSANGQSDGYYQGNTNSVQVSLTGQSTAFVDSSASPSISGQAIGQSEVVYTQGSCDITAIGQSGCQQQGSISVPAFPTPPSSGRISVSSGGGGSVNTAGTPGSGSSNTPGTPGTGTPGTPGTPGTGTPGYAANGNSATGTAGAAGSAGGGAGQPGTAGSGSGSGYGTPGSPGSPGSGSPGTPGYSYSTAG